MKTVCLFLSALLFVSSAAAESLGLHEVPSAVTTTFSQTHAGISDVDWERVSGNYVAHYRGEQHKSSALISSTGKLLSTRTIITAEELPASIANYCKEKLPDTDLLEAAKIVDAAGKTRFEAVLRGMSFIFDESGKPISRTVD